MRVLVECHPDWAVVHCLDISKKQLLHERCKGEVVNRLRSMPGGVGMVDEDPGSSQPGDLTNYRQVGAAEGLRLLVRQGGGQRLVIVCPRLEEWLIQRARVCGVDPRQHHLPYDPKELHDIPRYERKEGFNSFLKELKTRDKGMRLLRQWLLKGSDSAQEEG